MNWRESEMLCSGVAWMRMNLMAQHQMASVSSFFQQRRVVRRRGRTEHSLKLCKATEGRWSSGGSYDLVCVFWERKRTSLPTPCKVLHHKMYHKELGVCPLETSGQSFDIEIKANWFLPRFYQGLICHTTCKSYRWPGLILGNKRVPWSSVRR